MGVATSPTDSAELAQARQTLIAELAERALVVGDVTLASGQTASYYIDAKRVLLSPAGFGAVGQLVVGQARRLGASAVGGLTIGADPVACAVLAMGADIEAFLVRKQPKPHGLQRWIEGPLRPPGDHCLIVDDVVTTGGSTISAIDHVRQEGLQVVGVVSVLDRLAGGGDAIAEAAQAPYVALTTIDDVYPERPDR